MGAQADAREDVARSRRRREERQVIDLGEMARRELQRGVLFEERALASRVMTWRDSAVVASCRPLVAQTRPFAKFLSRGGCWKQSARLSPRRERPYSELSKFLSSDGCSRPPACLPMRCGRPCPRTVQILEQGWMLESIRVRRRQCRARCSSKNCPNS